MASTPSTLPMRVTRTARGTHVVHVRGFSKLQEQQCGGGVGGFVRSPPFAAGGLDWAIRYYPGSDDGDDENSQVGIFVELQTEGAVAWAYVGLSLLHQTTGVADTFLWDDDPTLFDAAATATAAADDDDDECSSPTWGTYDVAARRVLRDSGFVRGDCLKIECVVDVCRDHLAFPDDPPTRKLAPLHVDDAAELLGSDDGADLAIHVAGAAGAGEPCAAFAAHTSVLDAYAPRFLKKHQLGKRQRRRPTTTTTTMMRLTVADADMPPSAVEAFLHYVYTDTLPVVAGGGITGDGYRAMLRHLLLAGKRYGVPRLAGICERLLCKCVDVETAAATLAMADRHGFERLRETCFEFVSDPDHYSLVRESKGYAKIFGAPFVATDVWKKYRERSGLPCDQEGMAWLYRR